MVFRFLTSTIHFLIMWARYCMCLGGALSIHLKSLWLWHISSGASVVSCGLLILSHNISAMIISPILLGYVLLRNRSYVWSLCLGFILAAYFWLPALFEKNFVTGLNS